MKQAIYHVLCEIFGYQIVAEWEDERYYYTRLGEDIVTGGMLHELYERDLMFLIDLDDGKDGMTLVFIK